MSLDLRDLLVNPGKRVSFSQELDLSRLDFLSVLSYNEVPYGEGIITNDAGAMLLRGSIHANLHCSCDRCTAEFDRKVNFPIEVPIAAELEDQENPDYFLLDGGELDIDDLLETYFILNMDGRFLCHEDCKGLCSRCGANLNNGPCSCKADLDPRLAVLEQLLENKDKTT